jgi:hypothetical protein
MIGRHHEVYLNRESIGADFGFSDASSEVVDVWQKLRGRKACLLTVSK